MCIVISNYDSGYLKLRIRNLIIRIDPSDINIFIFLKLRKTFGN